MPIDHQAHAGGQPPLHSTKQNGERSKSANTQGTASE
jgi:hypothetical protein